MTSAIRAPVKKASTRVIKKRLAERKAAIRATAPVIGEEVRGQVPTPVPATDVVNLAPASQPLNAGVLAAAMDAVLAVMSSNTDKPIDLPDKLATFELTLTLPVVPEEDLQGLVDMLVQGLRFHTAASFYRRAPALAQYYEIELEFVEYQSGSLKAIFACAVKLKNIALVQSRRWAGVVALASVFLGVPGAVESTVKQIGHDTQVALNQHVPQTQSTVTINNITTINITVNSPPAEKGAGIVSGGKHEVKPPAKKKKSEPFARP